ncbi:TonB-dependent receptor [Pedobacter endophyticus]|uniref:TonB-dependent receptor n=1 Tax=Pedobacter endophyticus TaxID=2789740 RepID=A0A7S9KY97_9SPHI|nr:TonB-dependent receptor [Pedobacter endophyticus]QPH39045.1 TonB-dependent receptor [Pedobacter endophyticus]
MKKIFSLLITVFISSLLYGQTGIIKGTLTTSNGKPAAHVSIVFEGTGKGTVSDVSGNYILNDVKAGTYILIASSLEFETQKTEVSVAVGQTTNLNLTLIENQGQLNDVVISAGRTPETIDQIPSSVTVVGLKTLQDNINISSNIATILQTYVPGLAPSTGLSSNAGQTLRGRSLLIMVDGVPQSTPLRNGAMDLRALDPAVIERVEVVKGATAIYGNGAAGGLINYFTRSAKTDKVINSQTSIATTGSLVNKANSMGGRISQLFYGDKGKLSYALSGVYEQTGELKDAKGDIMPPVYGLGETDSYNAFAKLGYKFNSKHKVQATYNFYSSRQATNYITVNGDYAKGIKTTAMQGQASGVPQGVKGNHNANIFFAGETGVANTTYNADFYYQSVDNVFFYSEAFVDGGVSRVLSKKNGARLVLNTPFYFASADANVTYGLDAQRDRTSQPLVDGRIWVPEMDMVNYAPFAQARFTFFDKLILKGGLRFESVNIEVNDYKTLPSKNTTTGVVTPSIDVRGGNLHYNPLVFNVGLRYNTSDYFSPYISFSQGFTVSDVGVALRAAKVNDIAKINTEAVIVDSYEAGFVSKVKNLRFEATGYISKSSLGANSVFNNGEYIVVRAPERIYGFELNAEMKVTKALKAAVNYSFVEGKADADDDGKYNGEKDEYLSGHRIGAPMFGANINYSILSGKLNLLLQYTGITSRDRFAKKANGLYNPFEGPVKAYNLFNSAIFYHITPATSINLGVENMFNEDYFTPRSQYTARNTDYIKGKGASYRLTLNIRI